MLKQFTKSIIRPSIGLTTRRTTPSNRPFTMSNSNMEQPTQNNTSAESAKLNQVVDPPPSSTANKQQEQPLPPLSRQDFHAYNHMSEHMNYFHNHFRSTWETLYSAANTGKRPANLSIRNYLNIASQFGRALTAHHTIEEVHIFPVLARKMECFEPKHHLLGQHAKIHEGLEKFEAYIEECRSGERELRLQEVKELMDAFGEVLWKHLDDEVEQLGAENMRKFWTKEEMRRMPM